MKFVENFFRSFSLMALSWTTRLRRFSATLFFSKMANVLKASLTTVSTFAVALGVGASESSVGRALLATGVLGSGASLTESCFASVDGASTEDVAADTVFSTGLVGATFSP